METKYPYPGYPGRLKQRMDEKGMKMFHLAMATGTNQSTIQRHLKKENVPSKSMVKRFAEALGVNFDWLLYGIGEKIWVDPTVLLEKLKKESADFKHRFEKCEAKLRGLERSVVDKEKLIANLERELEILRSPQRGARTAG